MHCPQICCWVGETSCPCPGAICAEHWGEKQLLRTKWCDSWHHDRGRRWITIYCFSIILSLVQTPPAHGSTLKGAARHESILTMNHSCDPHNDTVGTIVFIVYWSLFSCLFVSLWTGNLSKCNWRQYTFTLEHKSKWEAEMLDAMILSISSVFTFIPCVRLPLVRFGSDDNDVITCSAHLSHSPSKSSNKLIREYDASTYDIPTHCLFKTTRTDGIL